jgi:signal transduction histidine kinase
VKTSDVQFIQGLVVVFVALLLTSTSAVHMQIATLRFDAFPPAQVPSAFLTQARFLVPVLVVSSAHCLVPIPTIARFSIVLLRILMIQMLIVFSRGALLPVLLMLIPVGIETGALLPGVTGGLAWVGGMVIIYLFGMVDSAWNVPIETYSFFATATTAAVLAPACLIGNGIHRILARIEHNRALSLRLQESVLTLTRANLKFMQYAATAEARSKEEERARITRDIHDSLGYALTNILAMTRLIARLAPKPADQIAEIARQVEGQAQEGMLQMRGAVRKLRATRDDEAAGPSAILRLIQTFSMATGIAVTAEFSTAVWPKKQGADEVLYHIVQESLTNSFRHGHATRIEVVFSRVNGGIRVVVEDNGVGAGIVELGIGLEGMAERARALGGYAGVEPIGSGFRVVGWLPV